jgi:hypothetical protein
VSKGKQEKRQFLVKSRRIIDVVKKLGLPAGEYAVFGSGIMEVCGLRESGDVDFIMTKRLFDDLAATPKWERFVYENNGDEAIKYQGDFVDVGFWECNYFPGCDEAGILRMIKNADIIDGVSFVGLTDTMGWKSGSGREKDLRDVEMIREFLEKKGEEK